MGSLVLSYADYDGEVSTVTIPQPDMTAANSDALYAAGLTLQNALGDVLLGKLLKKTHVAKTSPLGVGRSGDELSQRESKALVRYYDSITYEKSTLELPCADLALQNPDYPGVFYLEGAANNEADWETFVTAFEANVKGAGGNASVVSEIIHVGRNLECVNGHGQRQMHRVRLPAVPYGYRTTN